MESPKLLLLQAALHPSMNVTAINDVLNPRHTASLLSQAWFPKVIAEVDDCYVKVAKMRGTFTWHSHEAEDELFLVLQGTLRIELRDRTVELSEGELFVVPRGVEHNPSADEECLVLLLERKSTQHTGSVVTDQTRSIAAQLADYASVSRP